jgi:uncharacterized membrane protein HdeD (DUF308 family)
MSVAVDEGRASVRAGGWAPPWWLFLITGICWLILSLVVLRFDITSVTTVGILLGVVLIGAGITEIVSAPGRGVRWAHLLLGILFLIGGTWALFSPGNAFWELASILGFLLVLKGSMDIVASVLTRQVNDLWWLGLVVGIVEVLLAFWVSQQFFRPRAALIILWVGFMALFRGFSEIALAFALRREERDSLRLA